LREALRVFAPLGIVEVDSQEVAGVVGKQRVDAGGVPPGKGSKIVRSVSAIKLRGHSLNT
jgi:hypothetical protein